MSIEAFSSSLCKSFRPATVFAVVCRNYVRSTVRNPSGPVLWLFPALIFGGAVSMIYLAAGADELLPYAVAGTVAIGMWSSSLYSTTVAAMTDPWLGTDLVISASPTQLSTVVLSRAWTTALAGTAAGGIASIAVVALAHPPSLSINVVALLITIPLGVLAVGSMAALACALVMLMGARLGPIAVTDSAVVFLSAALFPVGVLGRLSPLSRLLSPYWVSRGILHGISANAGDPELWQIAIALLLLAAIQIVAASQVLFVIENRLRRASQ
ncbi:MAG: hypothetical protein ACRD2A_24290 [Vicinamibacterales bacterium]